MRDVRTIAIDDLIVWAFASLSVTQVAVLTYSLDGATLMQPLLHYFSHLLFICIYSQTRQRVHTELVVLFLCSARINSVVACCTTIAKPRN